MMRMWLPFQTVTDLVAGADVLRLRRHGVIETCAEALFRVRLRPFPKLVSAWHVMWSGALWHERSRGNRCWVYYHQPLGHARFLAVTYVVSTGDCSLGTLRLAGRVLDEIARLKGIDALVCDVGHSRISDRLLRRAGWEPLAPRRWHRNYVKRFYGVFAAPLVVGTRTAEAR